MDALTQMRKSCDIAETRKHAGKIKVATYHGKLLDLPPTTA